MRVVLDANVIVAAFAAHGLCHAVVEACLEKHEVMVSEQLLAEVRKALVVKVRVPPQLADDIVRFLREETTSTQPAALDSSVCPDPNDAHVLGLVVASDCELLVTGDRQLLGLGCFGAAPIISPRELWVRLRASAEED